MGKMKEVALELQEHGFESLDEARDNGYELIGTTLYKTAEKALQDEKDEQLDKLDEVIAYFKEEQGEAEGGIETYMIDKLKDVEKYIKERS